MNITFKNKLKARYEYSIEYGEMDYIIYTGDNGEICCIEEQVGGPYGQSHFYTTANEKENHWETIGFIQLQIMGLEIINKGSCWSAWSNSHNDLDLDEASKFRWPAAKQQASFLFSIYILFFLKGE